MCVRGIEYASTISQLDIPTVCDGAIFKHILLNAKHDLLLYNMFVFMVLRALETGRITNLGRAFQACFAASTNEFYI
jgi:hypothetical protein